MPDLKTLLYEQVSRIGKALASPKRLELIELLCQGEKAVEALAREAGIGVKLASAHLKDLRAAQLIEARRHGKYVYYRIADPSVAELWVKVRELAEERFLDLQMALQKLVEPGTQLQGVDSTSLLKRAKKGEVVVIDVRPAEEFATSHLPCARSMPLAELQQCLKLLPKGKPIVAYCRGPFCMMAKDAVTVLRKRGYRAFKLADGVAEWRSKGLPLEQ